MHKILFIVLLLTLGCASTNSRLPSNASGLYSTESGSIGKYLRDFMQRKNIVKNCEDGPCVLTAVDVACNHDKNSPHAECMWFVKKETGARSTNEILIKEEADYIYNLLKKSGVPEVCNEIGCSVQVMRISCYITNPDDSKACSLSQ